MGGGRQAFGKRFLFNGTLSADVSGGGDGDGCSHVPRLLCVIPLSISVARLDHYTAASHESAASPDRISYIGGFFFFFG